MRRSLALIATFVVALGLTGVAAAVRPATPTTPAPAPSAPATKSWADPQIRIVTAAGILGDDPATFRPTDPLTRGELADALGGVGEACRHAGRSVEARDDERARCPARRRARVDACRAPDPDRCARCRAGADLTARHGDRRAAPRPPAQSSAGLRRSRASPVPAGNARRGGVLAGPRRRPHGRAGHLARPARARRSRSRSSSTWQRAVLGRALRFVGYPYVWAGTSEVTQKVWSATAPGGWVTAPGGFDCSGFVWRVYKTKPFPGAPLLGDILKGRTTYAMSGEVKKPARIGIADLEPGDVDLLRRSRAASRPRSRSATRGSTSATAGSSTRRARA